MKKILSILFVLALVLSFSVVATTPVAAATITVGPTGDYATIQAAVDAASPGDTIVVAAGTYVGATVNKAVSIEAKTGDVVIINDGPNTHTHSRAGFYFAGDYSGSGATIRGFNIQGAIQFGTADDGKLDFAVFSRGANDVVIEKNVISDMLQGITSWHGNGWLIDDNVITDLWCRNGGGIGVFVGAFNGATVDDNVISNNVITGILSVNPADGGGYSGTGIALMADFRWGSAGGTVRDNIVSDNYVSITSDTPGTVNFQGMQLTDSRADDANPAAVLDNQVVWNSILGNGSVGIRVSAGTSGNSINFNSIVGNPQYGVLYLGTGALDATLNWWGDASGPYHTTSNAGGTGDQVSDSVNFMPWLMEEDGAETTETNTDSGTGASASTTNVAATATGGNAGTTVTVGEYVGNPTGASPGFRSGAVYIDVHVGGPAPLPTQLMVEVACPSGVCSGVVLQWWDGDGWESVDAPTSVVNGKIQFVLSATSSPTIAQLTGTILGLGGLSTVGWEGSSVDKAAVMVPWIALMAAMMAGATLLVVRRRRAQI